MTEDGRVANLLAEHYQKGRKEFAEELYQSFFEMEGEVVQIDIGEYDKIISAHLIKDKMDELNKKFVLVGEGEKWV